jgi:hypothetical protein
MYYSYLPDWSRFLMRGLVPRPSNGCRPVWSGFRGGGRTKLGTPQNSWYPRGVGKQQVANGDIRQRFLLGISTLDTTGDTRIG